MKNFIETVFAKDFADNGKGQMKQNERNELRSEMVEALAEALKELGFEAVMTNDGVGVNLQNDGLGAIPVIVGVTVKGLEFDIFDAETEYLEKVAEKVEKEKVKQAEKERKIAEKEALAKLRAEKKNSKK